MTCVYIHFLKQLQAEGLELHQKELLRNFFKEFALYVLRLLNILRIFICLYSEITIMLCVNYEEAKMIDAL